MKETLIGWSIQLADDDHPYGDNTLITHHNDVTIDGQVINKRYVTFIGLFGLDLMIDVLTVLPLEVTASK